MCILTGIGNAMAYCPGVIIVSIYFHKKLGTAVGIATSGVGLGAFSVPLWHCCIVLFLFSRI
jgi:hypothetical protein